MAIFKRVLGPKPAAGSDRVDRSPQLADELILLDETRVPEPLMQPVLLAGDHHECRGRAHLEPREEVGDVLHVGLEDTTAPLNSSASSSTIPSMVRHGWQSGFQKSMNTGLPDWNAASNSAAVSIRRALTRLLNSPIALILAVPASTPNRLRRITS